MVSGRCHAVFKQTCIDAGHMVLCIKQNTYSKWEGHCPPCEREWKAQEKEITKAEAALKAERSKEEVEAIMKNKKTKKTGKGGKKLVSKILSSWAGAKRESCTKQNLVGSLTAPSTG